MSRRTAVVRTLFFVLVFASPSLSPVADSIAGVSPASSAATSVPANFEELAAGVGLSYRRPEGFQDAPVVFNSLWSYEHAVRAGFKHRDSIRRPTYSAHGDCLR